MSEEKKKESFTFSDKIKGSKRASTKSFANRVPSKVGSDGKPRQTLFERTKRDAPFFIAALVALLLLPFLYKYSGSVDENATLPPTDDTIFDPGTSWKGVPEFSEDPNQVRLYNGVDTVGWVAKEKQDTDSKVDDADLRNGPNFAAGTSASAAKKLETMDEEENIKNIYRYPKNRKTIPSKVRTGFQRTEIKGLKGAQRATPGGSKLDVGMYGGKLKSAANKIKPQGAQNATKPVSLQPLQAAGKGGRFFSGGSPFNEARRSKDAMTKANAMQALMDAQMRPIDPGKIGGIMGGEFGGPGGGNGNLKREFLYNGKEPWWWDLMKQKEMMKWQKQLEYKWGLINWATDLLKNILGGITNCILTGTDDGSMGKLWRVKAGAGKESKCGKFTAEDWAKCRDCMAVGDFGKAACYGFFKYTGKDGDVDPWQEGSQAGADMGWWNSRVDCMVNGLGAARAGRHSGDGVQKEVSDCTQFYQTGNYRAVFGGDYTPYVYVVGVPFGKDLQNFFAEPTPSKREQYLKIAFLRQGNELAINSSDVKQKLNHKKFMPLFVETVAIKNSKVGKGDKIPAYKKNRTDAAAALKERTFEEAEDFVPGSEDKFVGMPYSTFKEKLRKGGVVYEAEGVTELSAKGNKRFSGANLGARCAYPMAFIGCHNNALYKNDNIVEGETIAGAPAAFLKMPNLTSQSGAISNADIEQVKQYFNVMYEIQGRDEKTSTGLSTSTNPKTGRLYYANIHSSNDSYKSTRGYNSDRVTDDDGTEMAPDKDTYIVKVEGKALDSINKLLGNGQQSAPANKEKDDDDSEPQENRVVVTWTVRQIFDPTTPWNLAEPISHGKGKAIEAQKGSEGAQPGGQIVSQATCVYFDDDTVGPGFHLDECKEGEWQTSERCCKEYALKSKENYQWNPETKTCEQKPTTPPPGTPPVAEKTTRLAKFFEWIPQDFDCRNAVKEGERETAQTFCDAKKIKVGRDDQHCAYPVGELVLNSSTAKEFVKDVVAEYNKTHQDAPIAYDGSYPTSGEFVDALNIALKIGKTQVSKSAVCELGRRMVQVSKDPHMNSEEWHNELGVFFAYIHKESVFYPAKFYKEYGNCDQRFMGKGIDEGVCKNGTVPQAFHHNNYTYNGKTGINAYQKSAEALKLPLNNAQKKYLLAALAQDIAFDGYNTCYNRRSSQKFTCGTEVNAYKRAMDPLIDSRSDSGGEGPGDGNACDILSGTMAVQDALDYAVQVCETGLNVKPYSVSGNGNGSTLEDPNHTTDPAVNEDDDSSTKR